jgi:hypothetical protein
MDDDLRHENYKGYDIKSRPVSVDLPGSDNTWQVRIYITSPDGVTRERLLENPFYKNKADALEVGLKWGREILEGDINKPATSLPT